MLANATTGIILFTQNLERCCGFYEDVLGMTCIERTQELASYQFGGAYLMLEFRPSETPQSARQHYVLRLNTDDLAEICDTLKSRGLSPLTHVFEWGTIAAVFDPDGNRIEFKSPAAVA